MSVSEDRQLALDILRALRRGRYIDEALAAAFSEKPSCAGRRSWVQELTYGTMRLRGRLDYLLNGLIRRGNDSVPPEVLDIMRLGAYQLLEMDSVPDYAAVSQAVEQARDRAGAGAGRLANGVLRSLQRQKDSLSFPSFQQDPVAHLTGWGSHPLWLVERWIARYGKDGANALVEANNTRPQLFFRPVGYAGDDVLRCLNDNGIAAEAVSMSPDVVRLLEPSSLFQAMEKVPGIVQDPAAALVSRYAAPEPGACVVDLCAAPGGKAIALAEALACGPKNGPKNGFSGRSMGTGSVASGSGCNGWVLATDISYRRLGVLLENVGRFPSLPLSVAVADGRQPPIRTADLVLLDVPCTGTGTLRRHPDGKWRLKPEDLVTLTALQRDLLDGAAGIVAPGGLLVYATCSLEPEENELQVDGFLARNPDFEREAAEVVQPELLDECGHLVLLPQRTGFDGAFAARLRRCS